jgi:hypothetical protein
MIPVGRVAKTYGGPDLMESGIREVNADWDNFRNWPRALDVAAQAIVSFQGNCGSSRPMLETALMTRCGHSPVSI